MTFADQLRAALYPKYFLNKIALEKCVAEIVALKDARVPAMEGALDEIVEMTTLQGRRQRQLPITAAINEIAVKGLGK